MRYLHYSQWRSKVGVGPMCARIPKRPPLFFTQGLSRPPTAMGPRTLHALHSLLPATDYSHIHQVDINMQNLRHCQWVMCNLCREGVNTRIYRGWE